MDRLRPHIPLALAMALAATLQAIHVARSPTISADGITFISIARDLPQGLRQSFRKHDQHPGYPALLLGATRVVQSLGYREEPGSWAVGGVVVAYLCGLASVAMVWLLARNLFDERVAAFAAIGFAVLPVVCWNAGDAHSDVPHLFVYLLAAWLASSGIISGRAWTLAGAGAASGIAYWIRPEGLEVFLIALVCLLWQAVRSDWAWRRVGMATLALAGSTLIVAAPYLVLAGKITSKQLPFAKTEKVQTFIDLVASTELNANVETASPSQPQSPANVSVAPPLAAAQPPATSGIAVAGPLAESKPAEPQAPAASVAQSPVPAASATPPGPRRYTAKLVFKLLVQAFSAFINSISQGLKFVFIPFYLLGHIECARRRPRWLQVGMMALLGVTHFCLLLAVFILSGYIAHRHVLPMVAIAMPWVALGIFYVADYCSRLTRLPREYAAAGILAICCTSVLPYTVRAQNREFIPVMAATEWVEQQAPEGAGIVCNSPYVGFYGHRPIAYLSHEAPTLEQALAKGSPGTHFDYVVLHVNAHEYLTQWADQIAERYDQLRVFPDPSSTSRPKEVRVYRAKQGASGRLADAPQRSGGSERK